MSGSLFLGTSGFAFPEWRGEFYPPTVRAKDMLSYYAGWFRSVEINYTFRNQPSEETLAAWAAATPETFTFAMKAPQRITHFLRLRDAGDEVSVFLDRVKLLGPRLGPVLFQCPPNLRFDRPLIEGFLAHLPPTFRYAFEFRHPSWEDAKDILAGHGTAWCVAETDERHVTDERIPASPFAFLRLRRAQYEEAEFHAWARRIREALDAGADVFCYFKHEGDATGVRHGLRMAALVEGAESPAAG